MSTSGWILGMIGALAVASAPASLAQQREMGGVGITVYVDSNFRGKSATIREDTPDLNRLGINDRISSFRVAPGEQWEVCVDSNYRGRCVVVYGDESDLRPMGWGDTISSLRRIDDGGTQPGRPTPPSQGGDYVVLYDQPSYRGNVMNYSSAQASLGRFNDRAASITIGQGVWEVCEHANFEGRCVILDKNTADLGTVGLSRRVSSIRPARDTGSGQGDWYIVLYDQPSYRGSVQNYKGAQPRLEGFNDRAASVTIGRGVWELCEHANFKGRCITLDASTADLNSVGMNRQVSSVRPVHRQPK